MSASLVKTQRGRGSVIPGKKTAKPSGPKKRVITFKPDADVEEFIDSMVASGTRQTDVIEDSIRIVRDLAAGLGIEDWAEVEKQAKVRGVSIGVVLAEYCKPALEFAHLGRAPGTPKKGGKG